MKVLLTGGTGFLGRAIVRALAGRGHELVIFARAATASALPGTLFDGDVRDLAALTRAAAGCDAILHAAALVSIWRRRRADFDDVNVGGLKNAIAAAEAAHIERVLYTSSFLALPPADGTLPLELNDYQRTKVAAGHLSDQYVAEGRPLIRLYPGVVYGPGALTEGNLLGRLIGDHLSRKLPGLIGRERRWSYAYIDDVAGGHVAALERGRLSERYVLGGENASQQRVFEIVQQITGRRPPRSIPFAAALLAGALEEARVSVFGGMPLVTRGAVEIFRHDWSLDSSLATREIGYAITPLAEGVQRTIASLRATAPQAAGA
ncbi:MAG TPA: NAD-dependent epimerase/dehydratase family protein [Vicinamibacterales bacterium]